MASTVASQISFADSRTPKKNKRFREKSFHLYIIEQLRRNVVFLTSYLLLLTSLVSCSSSKYISKQADQIILSDSNLTSAHVGISIYDPSTNKYLYNHDGDKYFIPASNTKLMTCYAAMKHLGDSLVGLKVQEYESRIVLSATADPTLLQPEFKTHPVIDFLKNSNKELWGFSGRWKENAYGLGWSWDDYNSEDMSEKSSLPIYGNVIRFWGTKAKFSYYPKLMTENEIAIYSKNGAVGFISNGDRMKDKNIFRVDIDGKSEKIIKVPFITSNELAFKLLADTLRKEIITGMPLPPPSSNPSPQEINHIDYIIHSQPTDSVLKPMMHRSDNFFAEQMLLMVSNEITGVMNDEKISDSLLKTDFKDLPQKPRWVDGSGLSRYNLSTPQNFITVLNKMKTDFSWDRITTILATGGEGTLTNYYLNLKDRIFAKTGTLSNNVALSGFLITKQNKTLIFSVLVNNHMGSTTKIRKAVEKFLTSIVEKY